jgi:hypothetical protein
MNDEKSPERAEPEAQGSTPPRIKCDGCNSDYDAKWAGTTCSNCDGTIGGIAAEPAPPVAPAPPVMPDQEAEVKPETLGECVSRLAEEESNFSGESISPKLLQNIVKRVARNAYLCGVEAGKAGIWPPTK